ncbi:hypothetical protein DUNSADRAFT_17923 [Dunaliella salina]|uniref:RING-type domain-containing protein n=1 Tax=Dunaliella salina TaxID=3046 RepID=A0ABQ7H913_DUNSA|nr:hypothetical protein DUNSADRAFT_17923 [Dunaliella salina]|eukprot:KAF5843345.1 hypothetical protein DUNSADRAFT_17923 [Dunaliella salina]
MAATAARPVPVVLHDDDECAEHQENRRQDGAGPATETGSSRGTSRQQQRQEQQGPSRKRRRGQRENSKAVCVDLTSLSDSDPDEVQCILDRRAPPRAQRPVLASSSQQGCLLPQQQVNPGKSIAASSASALPALPPASAEPGIKCPVCLDPITQMSTTHCGHVFCMPCIKDCIKAQKRCPKCRKALTMKQVHRVFLE